MALAGVASAATVGTIDKTDEDLLSYLDFSSAPSNAQYGNGASVKDGYGTIDSTHQMYTTSWDGTVATGAFTLSFDVRNFGSGDLLCVASNGAGSYIQSNLDKVTLNTGTNNTLELKFFDNKEVATTISTGIKNNTTRTDWTTITLVGEIVTTDTVNTQYVSLYVDGTYIDQLNMTTLSPGGWCGRTIDGFQFGAAFRSAGTTTPMSGSAEIDNVLFYQRALTATEVKGLVIPEPTTATLSLLALAGLAARRRRK